MGRSQKQGKGAEFECTVGQRRIRAYVSKQLRRTAAERWSAGGEESNSAVAHQQPPRLCLEFLRDLCISVTREAESFSVGAEKYTAIMPERVPLLCQPHVLMHTAAELKHKSRPADNHGPLTANR